MASKVAVVLIPAQSTERMQREDDNRRQGYALSDWYLDNVVAGSGH